MSLDSALKRTKRFVLNVIMQMIARFPFWDAVSTMMLFAEMEGKTKSKVNIPTYIVYADAVFLITLGTFMSFMPSSRRACAILSAIQVAARSVLHIRIHGSLPFDVFLHITIRNIGVIASYVLLASGFGALKAKRSSVLQVACVLFGLLQITQAVLLVTSEFEQKFLVHFLPRQLQITVGKTLIVPAMCLCLTLSAVAFVMRRKGFVQAKRFILIFWLCVCFPGDIKFLKWSKTIESWTYYRLVASSLCTLASLSAFTLADL